MESEISYFTNAIISSPDFRFQLYELVGATYTSLIEHLLWGNITLNKKLQNMYLSPMKDMLEYEDWITEKINDGYNAMLIGDGARLLMQRIRTPLQYFQLYDTLSPIVLWIAVVNKQKTVYTAFNAPMKPIHISANSIDMYINKPDFWFMRLPMSQNTTKDCGWTTDARVGHTGIKVMQYEYSSGYDSLNCAYMDNDILEVDDNALNWSDTNSYKPISRLLCCSDQIVSRAPDTKLKLHYVDLNHSMHVLRVTEMMTRPSNTDHEHCIRVYLNQSFSVDHGFQNVFEIPIA